MTLIWRMPPAEHRGTRMEGLHGPPVPRYSGVPQSATQLEREVNMASVSRSPRARRTPARRAIGRLTRYEIRELFGIFNYSFDLDAQDITLLTGVNGTGKSTILRTIDAICTGNWLSLLEIPFKSLTLGFDNNRELTVNRPKGQSLVVGMTDEESWTLGDPGDDALFPGKEASFLRYNAILRDLERRRADSEISESMLRNEIAHLRRRMLDVGTPPEWVEQLPSAFPVLFITDQRLIVDNPKRRGERETSERIPTRVAADEAARQIAREISIAKSAYANRSQLLDRDLPQRVVRALGQSPRVSESVLRQRLDELTQQSKDLESVGLSPPDSVGEFENLDLGTAHVRSFMKVYIEDARMKLSILEPLRVKLQLFTEFLRQHYGRKYVQIDPERGLIIKVEDKEAPELQPSRLSSGEQQMLVLAHEILFKATPGTLVLIDEPELSLHVLWQASFVEDLAVMGKVNNLSFLLATHSPTLIGGREDLKRSLDVIGR